MRDAVRLPAAGDRFDFAQSISAGVCLPKRFGFKLVTPLQPPCSALRPALCLVVD